VTSKIRHTEAFYDALEEFRGRLISRNIRIGERRTSLRLTCLTWRLLHDMAQGASGTVDELCTTINSEKPHATPLSVAIRAAVLRYHLDADGRRRGE
jgi:predicted DNA-binding ribbon-helix-helix protein